MGMKMTWVLTKTNQVPPKEQNPSPHRRGQAPVNGHAQRSQGGRLRLLAGPARVPLEILEEKQLLEAAEAG